MDEREKIIAVIEKWADKAVVTKIHGASVCDTYNATELADALIAAGIRDITREGYICMNGEVIVPTPNIYNKVADLLACPRIKEREIEEEKK